MDDRERYDLDDVAAVIDRASHIDRDMPAGLTPAQVEAVGGELGIRRSAVRRGLAETRLHPTAAPGPVEHVLDRLLGPSQVVMLVTVMSAPAAALGRLGDLLRRRLVDRVGPDVAMWEQRRGRWPDGGIGPGVVRLRAAVTAIEDAPDRVQRSVLRVEADMAEARSGTAWLLASIGLAALLVLAATRSPMTGLVVVAGAWLLSIAVVAEYRSRRDAVSTRLRELAGGLDPPLPSRDLVG